MAVYDNFIGGGSSTILGLTTKKSGQALQASIIVKNDGEMDWTFSVGFSVKDSAGKVYDGWNNNLVPEPGTGIEKKTIAKGGTATVTISNMVLPSDIALGQIQFIAVVYKESDLPVSTRLADTGWLQTDSNGNSISIAALDVKASITSLVVS